MLRVRDVMQTSFPITGEDEPIRKAGLVMRRVELELVPVVDEVGALVGIMTERALARRFIRESRETSTLEDTVSPSSGATSAQFDSSGTIAVDAHASDAA